MSVIATGHEQDPERYLVQGAFKFHVEHGRDGRTNAHPIFASQDQLIETAIALVNENPGGGEFLTVSVAGTADWETGIIFLYKMSHSESRTMHSVEILEDWLKRRHGAAYKGYSVGQSPILITLEKEGETKAA